MACTKALKRATCGETHGEEAREKWWFMVGSISAPVNYGEWCLVTP